LVKLPSTCPVTHSFVPGCPMPSRTRQ
jgi:hypothetical protein